MSLPGGKAAVQPSTRLYRRRLSVPCRGHLTAKNPLKGTLSLIGKHEPIVPVALRFEPILSMAPSSLSWCYLQGLPKTQLLSRDQVPANDRGSIPDSKSEQVRSTVVSTVSASFLADLRTFLFADPKSCAAIAENSPADLNRDRAFPMGKLRPDVGGNAGAGVIRWIAAHAAHVADQDPELPFGFLSALSIIEAKLGPIDRGGRFRRYDDRGRFRFRFWLTPVRLCVEEAEVSKVGVLAGHGRLAPSTWRSANCMDGTG